MTTGIQYRLGLSKDRFHLLSVPLFRALDAAFA